METRDRRINLVLLAAAAGAWLVVAGVVLTQDPVAIPIAGYLGAVAMGAAVGLTMAPLFWLVPFATNRGIALRGSWTRAGRRGLWTGLVVLLFVVLRLQGLFQFPLGLFIVALVAVAETTMSTER